MRWLRNKIFSIKYFFSKFEWMRIYFSPFKSPTPKFYIGKIAIGTPIFSPRRWIRSKDNPGYFTSIPKKIGFDFIGLGWKTKWSDTDVRFEWNPIWSFVFFKWQIAIRFGFSVNYNDHIWECWLIYRKHTDKSKSVIERLQEAKKKFPCTWAIYEGNNIKFKVNYWNMILKKKYSGKI